MGFARLLAVTSIVARLHYHFRFAADRLHLKTKTEHWTSSGTFRSECGLYEVTNREYRLFLEYLEKTNDHGRCHALEPGEKDHRPQYWNDRRYNHDDFPVAGVDWFDADAYCAWAGKALPTEAQWEMSARAGLEGQHYPWGHEMDKSWANLFRGAGERGAPLRDVGEGDPDQALQNRSPSSRNCPLPQYVEKGMSSH